MGTLELSVGDIWETRKGTRVAELEFHIIENPRDTSQVMAEKQIISLYNYPL